MNPSNKVQVSSHMMCTSLQCGHTTSRNTTALDIESDKARAAKGLDEEKTTGKKNQ